MPKRTHLLYILFIALSAVLVVSAVGLANQPHHAPVGSTSLLNRLSHAIIPKISWLPPLVQQSPWTPTFPPGSEVAGVDIGRRTAAEATALVTQALGQWTKPVPLITDTALLQPATPVLDLRPLGVALDVPALIGQANAQRERNEPVAVAWTPQLDRQQLRAALVQLAPRCAVSPAPLVTFTSGDPPRATFHTQTYRSLAVESTAARISTLLRTPSQPFTGTVVLHTGPRNATLADLDTALRQQIGQWNGVAGVAVHDLETDEWLGINDNTVFSGGSVLKVPALVYVYAKLSTLSPEQHTLADKLILESDNMAANALLAAAAGGTGNEDALRGAEGVTAMVQALGLEHTHLLVPYEGGEWLGVQGLLAPPLPPQEGAAPYTVPGDYLRTTPCEMAQFFTMVTQCAHGDGPLLAYWKGALTRQACGDIVALLARPHDTERMRAGIPPGVEVAHKGGWLLDMQADVGIVRSPKHTYVVSLFLWRADLVTDDHVSPSPYLGALSHTIYSFYNPE